MPVLKGAFKGEDLFWSPCLWLGTPTWCVGDRGACSRTWQILPIPWTAVKDALHDFILLLFLPDYVTPSATSPCNSHFEGLFLAPITKQAWLEQICVRTIAENTPARVTEVGVWTVHVPDAQWHGFQARTSKLGRASVSEKWLLGPWLAAKGDAKKQSKWQKYKWQVRQKIEVTNHIMAKFSSFLS